MKKVISWNAAEKIEYEANNHQPNSPEKDLLSDLLKLAVRDLHSRQPLVRRMAQWWIYKELRSVGAEVGQEEKKIATKVAQEQGTDRR